MKLKLKKPLPFEFIFDELSGLDYRVRPMFGAHAVYVGEKIVVILREKEEHARDNGVWIATTREHHESLRADFPSMRSIFLFEGEGPTGWQNLPAESSDFEESVLKLCRLIRKGDERVGKIPKPKKKKKPLRDERGGARATSRRKKR